MIRINYLVREYANGNYKAKYRNDFGFELPEGMIESIVQQMAKSIPEISNDFEVKKAKRMPNVKHKRKSQTQFVFSK